MAYKLEMAAKSGDFSGVIANNNALITALEDVVAGVQAWLTELDNRVSRPVLDRPDPLLLARLRKSCEDYDMKGIDEVMEELESTDFKNGASLVPWLRETINATDFSVAASRLREYEEGSP